MKKILQFVKNLLKWLRFGPSENLPSVKQYDHYNITQFDKEILSGINTVRELNQLAPLLLDQKASDVSGDHSQYMRWQCQTSHDFYVNRARAFMDHKSGEIVGDGYRSPAGFVAAWHASEDHLEKMLEDFTHAGVGTFINEHTGRIYATVFFLKPL